MNPTSTYLFQSHEERQRRQERGPAYAKAARKEEELRRQIGVLERQLTRDQEGGNDPDSPSGTTSEGGGASSGSSSNRGGSSFAIQKYRGRKKSGSSPSSSSNNNKKSPTRAEKLAAERQKKASILERRIEILEHEIMKDQKVSAQARARTHACAHALPANRKNHCVREHILCVSLWLLDIPCVFSLYPPAPRHSGRLRSYARKSMSLTIWRNSRQRCRPRLSLCRRS